MSDHNTPSGHGHSEGAHEMSDLNYRPILWIIPASLAFVVLFVTVIVFLTAAAASDEMTAKQYGGADADKTQLHTLRTREDSLLGFTGKDTSGHLRIPVEKAIEILASQKNQD
jgi:hypothetical protein